MLKGEREEAVYNDTGGSGSMTGEDAFAHLSKTTGIKNVE